MVTSQGIRFRFLAIALCFLASLTVASPLARSASIAVDVSAESRADGKPMLKISLTNKGDSELRIGPAQNPWVGPGMVRAVGMRLPEGTAIVEISRAVVDPSPLAERLLPGESTVDVIDLETMYPEIAAEIEKGQHDVVVFWTYQLASRESRSERLGGWVLFPRRKR